jgi:hypothetical protein
MSGDEFDVAAQLVEMLMMQAEILRDQAAVAAEHGRDDLAAILRATADDFDVDAMEKRPW